MPSISSEHLLKESRNLPDAVIRCRLITYTDVMNRRYTVGRRYSSQRFGGIAPDGERGSVAKMRRFFAAPAPAAPVAVAQSAPAARAGVPPLHCVFV